MKTRQIILSMVMILSVALIGAHSNLNSGASASAPASAPIAEVVINEVLYFEDAASADPRRNHEWVELHNRSGLPLDLSGWVVSDRGGRGGPGARALPSVSLPPGSYLVVHFAAGLNDLDFSDGCGVYFTGDPAAVDLLGNKMDEVALYSPVRIVDFVAWNQGESGYIPGVAHGDAVAAGQWTAGAFLNSEEIAHRPRERTRNVRPGTSIGRDRNSTDTDRPSDWDAHGGRDASDITPCRRNLDQLSLLPVPVPPPPPTPKDWTVMIYLGGDNDLESFGYRDLKEIEAAGGSDDAVNVVVMADGLNMYQQVAVDADNNLVPLPGRRGKTWRFQVGAAMDPRYVRMLTHGGDDPYLGERNMGDPAELREFITWTKSRYPAKNYGLILWDHGLGWKGIVWDDTFNGAREDADALFMGELSVALAGHQFEMIGFDACLMAMIEVAEQVRPFSKYMVASEETERGDGWPYDQWLPRLKANPGWDGAQLGAQIVKEYHEFYSAPPNLNPKHTLSLIDQSRLPNLVAVTSAFGEGLRRGSDDFMTHDTPADNVEHRIALDSEATDRFSDRNFMDLYDFADRINDDGGIPACYKGQAPRVLARLKAAVLAEQHGPIHARANGLSIYMPLKRMVEDPRLEPDDVYDYPFSSRVRDGDSPRAMYAPNNDALPLQARDVETRDPLAAPAIWPLVPTPGFRFPAITQWDEFLMRFYHPVADNRILYAEGPEGQRVFPKVSTPACGNAFDEITIKPGWTVYFSGRGSSDADTDNKLPRHWMWDFDHQTRGCGVCLPPYRLNPGSPADRADDDMDADHNANPAPLNDEKQADAPAASHTYWAPRDYVVTLNVWDDNHTFVYHDTNPTARYAHPQTDSHISLVRVAIDDQPPGCIPDPTGVTPNGQTFTRLTIRDADSGLAAIRLLEAPINAQAHIPAFEAGTKEPVVVTLTKIDQTKASLVKLQAVDLGGRSSACQSELLNPRPAPGSLSPNTAVARGATTRLTINGANFVRGATARWNGRERETIFISSTQLVTEILALDLISAGLANVTVSNPAPGGGSSEALPFNITPPRIILHITQPAKARAKF